MEKVLEMKQKRARLVKEARELLDRQEEEKRSLTAEEEAEYQRIDAEIDKLGVDIERREKQIQRERELGESGAKEVEKRGGPGIEEKRTLREILEDRSIFEGRTLEEVYEGIRTTDEYRAAFAGWLARGNSVLTAEEFRAMQAGDDASGGYLVAPQQMVWDLLKQVDDLAPIRQYATVHQLTKAASLGVPTLDKDADDWDWVGELATGGETELGFGKRELRPHPLSKEIKLSNTLLRIATIGPEALVRDRLSYKLAGTQEKAYMTGDGNQKPLGIFTPSADGISTSRDVSTGNTTTGVTGDGLLNAKYELKGAYHPRARWLLHRHVLRDIRKLKDLEGRYIWQPGITGGAPDRILELPYTLSEFAPNTLTAGKYVAVLGDFRYYWILDSLQMQIQRLVELYAKTNQTGFIGRYEGDGMPVLEEAFVRVQLAAQ